MLEPLGIRDEEERLYRHLLARKDAEISDFAAEVGRPADSVVAALARLEEFGLVYRLPERPTRVRAARPDVAVDLLVERRKEDLARVRLAARDLLAEMPAEERYRPEDIVEVLTDRAVIGARFEQSLHATQAELLVFDRPPYVSDAQRADASVRKLLRDQVVVRGIYAPEALELPGALAEVQAAVRAGEQSRVHDDLPMKLAIFDRRLAILPVGSGDINAAALCIRRSALLDALVRLFDLLWQQATPIAMPEPEDALTDRKLAALLAAGAKDDVVARHLRMSTRTLSRRIALLMDRLHVRTRFQAGVQAVRLGLIDVSVDVDGSDHGLVDR